MPARTLSLALLAAATLQLQWAPAQARGGGWRRQLAQEPVQSPADPYEGTEWATEFKSLVEARVNDITTVKRGKISNTCQDSINGNCWDSTNHMAISINTLVYIKVNITNTQFFAVSVWDGNKNAGIVGGPCDDNPPAAACNPDNGGSISYSKATLTGPDTNGMVVGYQVMWKPFDEANFTAADSSAISAQFQACKGANPTDLYTLAKCIYSGISQVRAVGCLPGGGADTTTDYEAPVTTYTTGRNIWAALITITGTDGKPIYGYCIVLPGPPGTAASSAPASSPATTPAPLQHPDLHPATTPAGPTESPTTAAG